MFISPLQVNALVPSGLLLQVEQRCVAAPTGQRRTCVWTKHTLAFVSPDILMWRDLVAGGLVPPEASIHLHGCVKDQVLTVEVDVHTHTHTTVLIGAQGPCCVCVWQQVSVIMMVGGKRTIICPPSPLTRSATKSISEIGENVGGRGGSLRLWDG